MQLIAAPWAPDLNAERQQAQDLAEQWCERWCGYYKSCAVAGQPYCGPDCQLEMDERNSR